ncbi:MAG: MFS transporter [Conexivisphaerales archaeon]
MGNTYQLAHALGLVIGAIWAVFLLLSRVPSDLFWRIELSFGAILAFIVLLFSVNVPETPLWEIDQGKLIDAKKISKELYGISLDMLPDKNVPKETEGHLADLVNGDKTVSKHPKEWRALLYESFGNITFAMEFAGFAFFIPILLNLLKISGSIHTTLIDAAVYIFAVISIFVSMRLIPKVGMRKMLIAGYSIVGVALIVSAFSLRFNFLVAIPFFMALYMFGHYWANELSETTSSLVSPTRYRGVISAFGNFTISVTAVITIITFTTLFNILGAPLSLIFIFLIATISGLLLSVFSYQKSINIPVMLSIKGKVA